MADQGIAPVIRARRQRPAVRAGNRLFEIGILRGIILQGLQCHLHAGRPVIERDLHKCLPLEDDGAMDTGTGQVCLVGDDTDSPGFADVRSAEVGAPSSRWPLVAGECGYGPQVDATSDVGGRPDGNEGYGMRRLAFAQPVSGKEDRVVRRGYPEQGGADGLPDVYLEIRHPARGGEWQGCAVAEGDPVG